MTSQDKQLLDELIKWFEAPDHTKTFTFRRKTRELLRDYREREKASNQISLLPTRECPTCMSHNPDNLFHFRLTACEDQWHNR